MNKSVVWMVFFAVRCYKCWVYPLSDVYIVLSSHDLAVFVILSPAAGPSTVRKLSPVFSYNYVFFGTLWQIKIIAER